jgi:hypothetical protein
MRPLSSFLPFAFAALAACDAGGSQPPSGPSCTTSADCPSDMFCEYLASAGCGAQGECGAPPGVSCTPQAVCSCTGVTMNVCVIGGYVAENPVRSTMACPGTVTTDAGVDAAIGSGSDASADAGSDASAD